MQIDLKNGDCIKLMRDIPQSSIDMILTDPPYGTTANKWDKVIPFELLWEQYNRIIKDNGVIVLFSQQPFTANLIHSNIKNFRYEWIWQKNNATGFLNANKMPLKAHENICVFYKRLPKYNPQMRQGFKPYECKKGNKKESSANYGQIKRVDSKSGGERYPIDVINFKVQRGLHPTQKPVELCEYLINTYTEEGDTVLDSCMGSGSVGVACINTKRHFIGHELDKNYFVIAKNRIEQAKSKLQAS